MKKVISIFIVCLMETSFAMKPNMTSNRNGGVQNGRQNLCMVPQRQINQLPSVSQMQYRGNQLLSAPMRQNLNEINAIVLPQSLPINVQLPTIPTRQLSAFWQPMHVCQNQLCNTDIGVEPQVNMQHKKIPVKLRKNVYNSNTQNDLDADKTHMMKPRRVEAEPPIKLKLTKINLDNYLSLTHFQVRSRVSQYIEEGKKDIDYGTALYPIFPLYRGR